MVVDQSPKCKKCGWQIVWCLLVSKENPHGKPHPLDVVPSFEGTIERKRGRHSDSWYGRVVPKAEREANPRRLYISHFATCRPEKGKPNG